MEDLAFFSEHILRLDHTAHAVRSIQDAARLYCDILGGVFLEGAVEKNGGFRWAQYRYPNGTKIELLEPMREDGFLARFLNHRGEGLHHLTFMVVRLEELVEKMKSAGYRIVGENYQDPAWKEAFISPRNAHGTIIQLVESNQPED